MTTASGCPSPDAGRRSSTPTTPDFGGSNTLTGAVTAQAPGWNDLDYSATLTLPPLGVVWLAHDPDRD